MSLRQIVSSGPRSKRRSHSHDNATWLVTSTTQIPKVVAADSTSPDVHLEILADGSVAAAGEMPAFEDYVFELEPGTGPARAPEPRSCLAKRGATPNRHDFPIASDPRATDDRVAFKSE